MVQAVPRDQQEMLGPRDRWVPLERWGRKVQPGRKVLMAQAVRKDQWGLLARTD